MKPSAEDKLVDGLDKFADALKAGDLLSRLRERIAKLRHEVNSDGSYPWRDAVLFEDAANEIERLRKSHLWTVVDRSTRRPVLPLDGFLVYRSQESAEAAAEHQSSTYDPGCVACRLDRVRLDTPRGRR